MFAKHRENATSNSSTLISLKHKKRPILFKMFDGSPLYFPTKYQVRLT